MAEYIVKPDYTMLSKESHGNLYRWNFGTDTEPERIVRCKDCRYGKNIDYAYRCYRQIGTPAVGDVGFCAWGEPKE